MKKIEAILRQTKLADVEQSLQSHGFEGMTISEADGLGREKGIKTIYRGGALAPQFVPRRKLELIVEDEQADQAIDAIYKAAHTGEVGDGRILVMNVASAIHIRTGETSGSWRPAGT